MVTLWGGAGPKGSRKHVGSKWKDVDEGVRGREGGREGGRERERGKRKDVDGGVKDRAEDVSMRQHTEYTEHAQHTEHVEDQEGREGKEEWGATGLEALETHDMGVEWADALEEAPDEVPYADVC